MDFTVTAMIKALDAATVCGNAPQVGQLRDGPLPSEQTVHVNVTPPDCTKLTSV